MTRVTLAVDAMGGDFGPSVTVPAVLQALASHSTLNILLVGHPDEIQPLLAIADSDVLSRLDVVASESVIGSDVKPSQAIRHSRGSSMRIALEMVKEGRAEACISAGNTGVLMGLATLLLKPMPGIRRPALMTLIPNAQKKQTVVLDLGANPSADAEMLLQFAMMGSVVAKQILDIQRPKVALLNIGHEEHKGLESIREASQCLTSMTEIDYIGYLEGNELLTGKTDVLVCDGFSGNVALKTMEGVVRLLLGMIKGDKSAKTRPWWQRFLMKYIKKRLSRQFGHMNPDQYNGASLLGLPGVVIKSHGAANQQAFAAAIEQTVFTVQRQIPQRIANQLATVLARSDRA